MEIAEWLWRRGRCAAYWIAIPGKEGRCRSNSTTQAAQQCSNGYIIRAIYNRHLFSSSSVHCIEDSCRCSKCTTLCARCVQSSVGRTLCPRISMITFTKSLILCHKPAAPKIAIQSKFRCVVWGYTGSTLDFPNICCVIWNFRLNFWLRIIGKLFTKTHTTTTFCAFYDNAWCRILIGYKGVFVCLTHRGIKCLISSIVCYTLFNSCKLDTLGIPKCRSISLFNPTEFCYFSETYGTYKTPRFFLLSIFYSFFFKFILVLR